MYRNVTPYSNVTVKGKFELSGQFALQNEEADSIDCFYSELIEAVRISPDKYLNKLEKMLASDAKAIQRLTRYSNEDFNYTINRLCYILINQISIQRYNKIYLSKLTNCLESQALLTPIGLKLRQFFKTVHYNLIKQLAAPTQPPHQKKLGKDKVIKQLVDRYPFLYEHYLAPETHKHHLKEMMAKRKKEKFRRFTTNLSTYLIHQSMTGVNFITASASRVENPTLLSLEQIDNAIVQFTEKVENNQSYQEVSRKFLTQTQLAENYQEFKQDFYQYMITSLSLNYQKSAFKTRLNQKLETLFPQYNTKKTDLILTHRTAAQILNFLVLESSHQLEHYTFVDLIANLGIFPTIGLLLKILLAYPETRPELEKRFAILFKHYESFSPEGMSWLVNILETLNIALSVHFEGLDVAGLKLIKSKQQREV